ncbi:MAG: DNA adenine methylase [Candidatus Methylomirabilales bacterium]
MSRQYHSFTSPLRYPGGKGALSNFMKLLVSQNGLLDGHYVEVYAGGAAVAWSLLFEEYVQHVHINDIDTTVCAFWNSVLERTDDICRMIHDTRVTIQAWKRQKAVLAHPEDHSPLQLGFAAFFLNRTNRSGIISGGVIGGKAQDGKWKLDARFNKHDLIARIVRIAGYADRITVYNLDAVNFIGHLLPAFPPRSLLYLDPPYYVKGGGLYEHHYTHQDHATIARIVSRLGDYAWVVSYDAAPEILRLYGRFRCVRYDLSYSAQDRYSGSEVIFLSPKLKLPAVSHPARVTSVQVRHASVTPATPLSA